MVSPDNIRAIVDTIVTTYQPSKIMLFGSYATGEATEDSDVDLLVVKDTNLPRHQRGREVHQHLYGSKSPMDIIIATPHELEQSLLKPCSFLYQALHSSKTVYER